MKMKIKLVILMVLICAVNVYGTVWFDDGGVHNIDYEINDEVQIWDDESTNIPTTVNLLEGGSIQGICQVSLNSQLNMSGGTINGDLSSYDYSKINISGGIVSSRIYANNNSNVNISGGEIGYLITYDNSDVNISGGVAHSPIATHGNGQLIISGGEINHYIRIYDDSTVYCNGGIFEQDFPWGFWLSERGNLFLVGSHFRLNDVFCGFGKINLTYGQLSGKLKNGDQIDVGFHVDNPTDFADIITIPEMPILSYCTKYSTMDFNHDCKVDLIDLAEFASQWLTCNLEPQSACWE